jgi:hypothetical protein
VTMSASSTVLHFGGGGAITISVLYFSCRKIGDKREPGSVSRLFFLVG